LLHADRLTEGQADRHDEAGRSWQFAKAPKHKTNFCIQKVNNVVQLKLQIMSYIIARAHRQDKEQ